MTGRRVMVPRTPDDNTQFQEPLSKRQISHLNSLLHQSLGQPIEAVCESSGTLEPSCTELPCLASNASCYTQVQR